MGVLIGLKRTKIYLAEDECIEDQCVLNFVSMNIVIILQVQQAPASEIEDQQDSHLICSLAQPESVLAFYV